MALAKLATSYQQKHHNHNYLKTKNSTTSTTATTSTSSTTTTTTNTTSSITTTNLNNITNTRTLNPAHAEFLQCCILASQYNVAKRFIDETPITFVSHKSTLSPESFLRFYYLSGMVYIACDDYYKSISAFQTCLTAPSKIVSSIMIEAMKKLVLVRCLLLYYEDEKLYTTTTTTHHRNSSGILGNKKNIGVKDDQQSISAKATTTSDAVLDNKEVLSQSKQLFNNIFELPNAVSACVYKYFTSNISGKYKRTMELYEALVNAFIVMDLELFNKKMNSGKEILIQDGNFGLVKQLIPLMQYRKVRNIACIYEAIPLNRLSKKLGFGDDADGVDATEALLLQIALRQKHSETFISPMSKIDFTIDSDSSVVYFYECGYNDGEDETEQAIEKLEREKTQVELAKRLAASMKLVERITNMDIDVTCSSQYQAIVSRENPEEGDKKPSGDLPHSVI